MNRYTIVIPVFGALEQVKRCLESVLRNTPRNHHVLVIDDCSAEAEVIRQLERMREETSDFFLEFHHHNVGFVRTANEGIKWSLEQGTEPILLNSDTVVPPRWIERLDEARIDSESNGVKVGAVCPLSNCASFYSMPNPFDNDLPDGLSVDEMDSLVEETSNVEFPEVPCAVGFCMLLTRQAIEQVGLFDTKWGKGYGEETEWSIKAGELGFACVLADNLFVYHEHHASFEAAIGEDELTELRKEQQEKFTEEYPQFLEVVKCWFLHNPQTAHRVQLAQRLRPRPAGPRKPHLVYVCHHWGELGGLEVFQRRLAHELKDLFEITVLHPTRSELVEDSFSEVIGGLLHITMSARMVQQQIDLGIFPFEFDAEFVEQWFATVIEALAPDLVHFHHLGGWGTFKLPEIAMAYAKTVLSVHDDFYLCPSYITAGWSCGREAADPCKQCIECVDNEMTVKVEGRHSERLPMLLERRQSDADRMLSKFNRIVFPGTVIRDRYARNMAVNLYPGYTEVIHHGVPKYPFIPTYKPGEVIRVAWVGGVLNEKGWQCFSDACRMLKRDERFEFSVYGEWHESADRSGIEHVTFHRRYSPEQLPQLLQSVDLAVPAVARKEAFGMVVDECLAAGCPVLLPDVATLRERLPGFGVCYQWGNAESLRDQLVAFVGVFAREVVANPFDRSKLGQGVKTLAECATEYAELYERLLQ